MQELFPRVQALKISLESLTEMAKRATSFKKAPARGSLFPN